jgi:copper(I)-binding protein
VKIAMSNALAVIFLEAGGPRLRAHWLRALYPRHMAKNNRGAALAAVAMLFIVRTAQADIEITEARAQFASDEPRRVEIYFALRNGVGHELKLQKVESSAAESVVMKQRSIGPDGQPRVWPVARFEVARDGSARLSAVGRFLVATGLTPALRVGQTLPLTLTFEDEQPITLQLTLEAAAPR